MIFYKLTFLRYFFLVLVISFPLVSIAQTSKLIKGKVVALGKDVTGVVVQNITTDKATITDFEGAFSIRVSVNDVLVFSAVQFKRKAIPITSDVYASNFLTVSLKEFVNELDEVVVQPFNLSGNLGSDVTGLQLEKDVSAEALELPNAGVRVITQSERKLQEASKGLYSLKRPLAVGLNPLINAITGRTKMLKERVKVDATYARTQRVQQFYVDSIISVELRIPFESIADFMYFCEVDSSFQATVDTQDKLKIWDFLVQKSVAYRENNELD